ncbi:HesB/YadR/YfhF family protein [Virgibacillus natechei]|uniref:HesB/YadR/YfhF family protein n=1 Tax=Virgibacillus sp. CBA3643 TaxID=2942278 RepID=UPI0035A3B32F
MQISKEVAKWYKQELDITDNPQLRFYVRYGGVGGNIPGFSLGIKKEEPEDVYTSVEVENITFFIKKKDAWYFEENDLKIHLNRKMMEPEFKYIDNK